MTDPVLVIKNKAPTDGNAVANTVIGGQDLSGELFVTIRSSNAGLSGAPGKVLKLVPAQ